jgi:hypothetical protein
MPGAAEGIGANFTEGLKSLDGSPPTTFDKSPTFLC